jgi:hypothetical protein
LTEISEQLVRQRVRNNIIDYLEVAASAAEQREYERNIIEAKSPGIVPVEMIEQWADQVREADFDWYCGPVFSAEENAAIREFHLVWDKVADDTPDPMPYTIEGLIGTEPWDRLMEAAGKALNVFEQRGRFSSDVEELF